MSMPDRIESLSKLKQEKFSKSTKLKKNNQAWTDQGIERETISLLFKMNASDRRNDDSLQVPFPFTTTTIIPTLESMTVRFIKHASSFGLRSDSSAYGFVSCFFFWYFLKCDWMATAAFSVSGASMSMSKSSGGMSFLDASVNSCILLFILSYLVVLSFYLSNNKQFANNQFYECKSNSASSHYLIVDDFPITACHIVLYSLYNIYWSASDSFMVWLWYVKDCSKSTEAFEMFEL